MAKTALPSSPVSHIMTGCLPGRTLSRIQPSLVGRRLVEVHFHDVCVLPFLQLDRDVPVKCVCGGEGGGKMSKVDYYSFPLYTDEELGQVVGDHKGVSVCVCVQGGGEERAEFNHIECLYSL